MAGIVMNVGPNAIRASGGSGGGAAGGQTLGAAQGTITINVNNVTQANQILQQSAQQINQIMQTTGKQAQTTAQQQIAASRIAAAQAKSQAAQTIAANNAIMSSAKVVATAQNTAAKQAQIAAQVTTAQQRALGATAQATAAQQRQAHAAVLQPIQQQIAQNRLLVSNINAQAAAARQAAAAQRQAAQQAITGWQALNKQLTDVRGELLALSLGAGFLTASGIDYAATLQEARIQLSGITGSLEAADKMMARLKETGQEAGVPFRQMIQFANELIPSLDRDTTNLDQWFDVIRRTATRNRGPMGGVSGATFSTREAYLSFLQGGRDFVSIADRFNISKKALQDALDDASQTFTDPQEIFINALDQVLTKMGVTTEVAEQMAKTYRSSFEIARDSAQQLLAEGFEPFLAVIAPMLHMAAEFMGYVNDWAPGLLIVSAAFLAITAAGIPLLLLVNQLTVAWAAMNAQMQATIKGAGRRAFQYAGVTAALLSAPSVGLNIANFLRERQGLEPVTMNDVVDDLKAGMYNFIVEFFRAGNSVVQGIYSFAAAVTDAVAAVLETIAGIQQSAAELVNVPFIRKALEQSSDILNSVAGGARDRSAGIRAGAERFEQGYWGSLVGPALNTFANRFDIGKRNRMIDPGDVIQESGFSRKQEEIILDTYNKINDITRDENRQIVETTRQYSEQRASIIADYEKSIAREARDFARQREYAERRFNLGLLDAAEDSALQRRRWQEDLDLTLAERRRESEEQREEQRKDYEERISELEKEYQDDREKALRDHREKLLDAAANLDAWAVYREQRRFAQESQEAEKEHQKRLAKERENYEERLEEDQKALDEFEQQQREAHARRLREQEEDDQRQRERQIRDFNSQKEQEDIERATRLADQAQDHQDQLSELDTQHGLRIQQIRDQAAEERQTVWDEHEAALAQTGLMTKAWMTEQQALLGNAIAAHRQFWQDLIAEIATAPKFPSLEDPYSLVKPSPVVTSSDVLRAAGNRTISFAQGAITVISQPGQSAEEIADAVMYRIVTVLEAK